MDFKKQLIRAYDKDAKRRDGKKGKRDQWKKDERQKFVNLLKAENKKTILELGSGAGFDAKYFQDNGFDVMASDLSGQMVKLCKKRGLNAKVVDLYDMSSIGTTFDSIYSMNVLLHVPRKDLKQVLENISNTLNKNGIFFYGVYTKGNDDETIFTDKTKMNLPRLFSLLSDETLLNVVKGQFEVIDFQKIDHNDQNDFYFQSLFLRKKNK